MLTSFAEKSNKQQKNNSSGFGKTQLKPYPYGNVLQRKCSCGSSHNHDGECEECKKKKLSLQGKPINYLQPKLTINSPDDIYEKEADAMADKVMRMTDKETLQTQPSPINIQRKCKECEKEEKQLQRKYTESENEEKVQKQLDSTSSHAASENIETSLNSSKGLGLPLPQNTREQMESAFGSNFSKVRIHNDSTAVKMNENLNAQAFTRGNDVYFNSGKYNPDSKEGKHLLAHELTHTVQQGATSKKKENDKNTSDLIQRAPASAKTVPTSLEVIDVSKGIFSPSDTVKKEIEDTKNKGLDVRIKAGTFAAEGIVRVKKKGETYDFNSPAYLPLTNTWLQKINVLVLRVDIKNNQVKGLVTIKGGGSNVSSWINALQKVESEIGMGFHFKGLQKTNNIINKLENGTLSLGFTDFTITIGGFFDLNLNLTIENMNMPVFFWIG